MSLQEFLTTGELPATRFSFLRLCASLRWYRHLGTHIHNHLAPLFVYEDRFPEQSSIESGLHQLDACFMEWCDSNIKRHQNVARYAQHMATHTKPQMFEVRNVLDELRWVINSCTTTLQSASAYIHADQSTLPHAYTQTQIDLRQLQANINHDIDSDRTLTLDLT